MRLRTFGGLWIEGETLPRALGPRRMALLAVIASAAQRGVSRDRILGLFWPETEEEQARHALSQTLYSLKRDTGRDWVVAASDLRLDPGITSDVGEFQEAVSAGDHAAALARYTGEFLDGFYLSDAPEFERWVEEERSRLRAAATRIAEQDATSADRAGDHTTAIRCWTRLTEIVPLSARYATGRIRALAAAGDRASALAHAREYEAVVRRELDADVDPGIKALVIELRSVQPLAPPLHVPAAFNAPSLPSEPAVRPSAIGELPGVTTDRAQQVPIASRRLAWPLLSAALVVSMALLWFLVFRPRPEPVLAVGMIRKLEMEESGSTGAVLRDMLSTSLGGLGSIHVVANSRLMELTPATKADEAATIAGAARRAGATELIEGELAREGGTLVLTLRRVDLARGDVRRGYVVRGANRYALVDSAAAMVARDLGVAPPTMAVRDVRTASPEAYALYNEGLRAYFNFDGQGAHRLMNAALDRDSNFAMAAYYAWQSGRFLLDGVTMRREFERAKRLAPHTVERERLLIQAATAAVEAPVATAAAIADTLVVRYPDDFDGLILLGELRQAQGDWAASIAVQQRAFAIDSAAESTAGPYCRICRVLGGMAETYQWWDSATAAERVAQRIVARRPSDPKNWAAVAEALLRQGRRAEAEAALERSGTVELVSDQWHPMLDRDLIRWGHLEELDRKLAIQVTALSPALRGEARWLWQLSLRDQGRFREARALALDGRIPGFSRRVVDASPDVVFGAMLLKEMGRPDSAGRLLRGEAQRVLADSALFRGMQARLATWYFTLAGSAYSEAGDTLVVRRLADSVEALGKGSTFGRDLTLHFYLRGLMLGRAGRDVEAVDAFRRALFSLSDGFTRINLELARSLLRLHRPLEAIAVLRPAIHGGVDGSNTYTSRTELHEAMAKAFEQAGQRDSALVHYRAVEQAWRHADPQFAERYRRAKAAAGS